MEIQSVAAGEAGWGQLTQGWYQRESEFSSELSRQPLESLEAGEIIFKRSHGLCVANRLEYTSGRTGENRKKAVAIE